MLSKKKVDVGALELQDIINSVYATLNISLIILKLIVQQVKSTVP